MKENDEEYVVVEESEESRKRAHKRTLKILAVSGITLVALIVATYAWFVGITTVYVENFNVEVEALQGLQISLDGETWNNYTEGITMADNGTVYFRGIDEAENISDVTSYEVTNIDKIAPTAPTVSADITEPTNQDVTITATFSEEGKPALKVTKKGKKKTSKK